MKHIFRLALIIACGLLMADSLQAETGPPPHARGNPHGAVWEEWQPLAEGFVARRRVPERLELPKEQRRSSATQVRVQPGRDKRPWEELSLWLYNDHPGLYSVSLDEIAAETGIRVNQLHGLANSGRLSFFNVGEPIPWYYDAQRRQLLFAAEAYETFHAEGNAYQLQQRQTPDPQRIIERGNARARISEGEPTPFRETLHFEEEAPMMFMLWLDPSNPDARYWFWDSLYGAFNPRIDVSLNIPDPAGHGTARMRIRLHGFTDLYPGDDHRVYASLNGYPAGSAISWDGLETAELLVEIDQALLNRDGDNTLTLHSDYDTSRPSGQLLESIEVEYLRLPVAAENGQLWMRGVTRGTQEVTGFKDANILVIESPLQNTVLRRDIKVYKDADGMWAVAFEAKGGTDYLLAEVASSLTPVIDPLGQADLMARENAAHSLIIAPRDFAGTANALAEIHQERKGLAKVVWLDDIYKNFSAGRVDPYAIGRFMAHVRAHWAIAPSAVTLVGKGSLDRKDRMGFEDNFLPVLMAANPWAIVPSDARLLGVEDGVAPFAIGRLPITNDSEGMSYVEKLLAHDQQQDWEGAYRAVVVADNPDRGGDFHKDADRLAAQLPRLGFSSVTKLYHNADEIGTHLIRSKTWDAGLITYSGHGSTAQLGTHSEDFINATNAALLRNTTYPVFVALTCTAGSDTFPGTRSVVSTLVLNPDGGAIAAFAPTGASLNSDAHLLGGAFIHHLFGRYSTIGDAAAGAKQQMRVRTNESTALLYTVTGDPVVFPR